MLRSQFSRGKLAAGPPWRPRQLAAVRPCLMHRWRWLRVWNRESNRCSAPGMLPQAVERSSHWTKVSRKYGSGSTLQQTLTGLTPGMTYDVNFLVTHRPGYGNDETLHVNGDGVMIWETRTPEDTFTAAQASFTATGDTHVLAFANDSPDGDKSVFVDEVTVVDVCGKVRAARVCHFVVLHR